MTFGVPRTAKVTIRASIKSIGGIEGGADGLIDALKNAKGYIRRSLGKRMIIRYTPELIFVDDRNIAYGVHIAKVLSEAIGTEEKTGGSDDQEA